jgi:hypothetical protein
MHRHAWGSDRALRHAIGPRFQVAPRSSAASHAPARAPAPRARMATDHGAGDAKRIKTRRTPHPPPPPPPPPTPPTRWAARARRRSMTKNVSARERLSRRSRPTVQHAPRRPDLPQVERVHAAPPCQHMKGATSVALSGTGRKVSMVRRGRDRVTGELRFTESVRSPAAVRRSRSHQRRPQISARLDNEANRDQRVHQDG